VTVFTVAASADDVRRFTGPDTFDTSSTFFMVGQTGGKIYNVAARFTNLTIAPGSKILTAVPSLVCAFASAGVTVRATLALEAVANATQIADVADFDGRSLTAAVTWEPAAWVLGTTYALPDIAVPLQAVMDLPAWAYGNAINWFLKDGGSDGGAARYGASWDNATYDPPVLTVTWNPPGGGGPVTQAFAAGII